MHRTFRYISNGDVKSVLDADAANRVAEETLVAMANGHIDWSIPRQQEMPVEESGTLFKVKGCHLTRERVVGFRVIGLNRTASGHQVMAERPTKHVLLYEADTGAMFAMVDERWSYGLRTGACGAVALKHLRSDGAAHLALIGTGHMAYGAAVTTAAAVDLDRITVWSRDPGNRERFAARLSEELKIEATAAPTAQECVAEAGLVITATNAREPFLKREDFAPGVTIYAMGGYQELEDAAYRDFDYYVDDREQVRLLEDIAGLEERHGYDDGWVTADLGEVVTGKHGGRSGQSDRILIRSQGLTAQDVVQSLWIYDELDRRDGGTRLEDVLTERPGDPLY